MPDSLASSVDELDLVDQHCHSTVRGELDLDGLLGFLTESAWPDRRSGNSPLGLAVRRWCAPVLELPRHTPLPEYVRRRAELGTEEVTRRFVGEVGLAELLVDSGPGSQALLELPEFSVAACVPVREIVRLEAVAESLDMAGVAGEDFPSAFRAALSEAPAVGWKTVAAYRYGLDLDPRRPTDAEVAEAAGRWLPSGSRLTDPVLLRFLLWSAADTGRPIQVHCGLGDPDETLRRADPAFLQPFLHEVRTPVVLLHCYPYHRQAAYLAHAYPHVYLDVGLALNYVGAAATTILGEVLELAPFHKVLYSSDAYGLPELYFLGATLFRRSLTEVLDRWVLRDDVSLGDAHTIAADIAAGNARELYGL